MVDAKLVPKKQFNEVFTAHHLIDVGCVIVWRCSVLDTQLIIKVWQTISRSWQHPVMFLLFPDASVEPHWLNLTTKLLFQKDLNLQLTIRTNEEQHKGVFKTPWSLVALEPLSTFWSLIASGKYYAQVSFWHLTIVLILRVRVRQAFEIWQSS